MVNKPNSECNDELAVKGFLEKVSAPLKRYSCTLAHNQYDRADLIQDTTLRLLQRFARISIDSINDPIAYAMRTMRNVFRDKLRKESQRPPFVALHDNDNDVRDSMRIINKGLFDDEYRNQIGKRHQIFGMEDFRLMANRLPHDLREVFNLVLDGNSDDEIAKRLGKDPEVIEARRKKAWGNFRFIYKQELRRRSQNSGS